MGFDSGPIASGAMFVGGLAASVLLLRCFTWWGRAAALSRARRIAARLRRPAVTLAEVEDQSAAIQDLVQFYDGQAAVSAARELLEEMEVAPRSAAIEILRRTRAFDQWVRDLRRGGYRAKLRAIDALGQVGDERAVEELIEALGDDDPDVARAAMQAVVRRDPDYASNRLADALSSPNRRVAETAAAALVHMGEAGVESLVSQLAALNPQARRLAVESLGAIGSPALPDLLLPLLESDPEAEVRVSVAEALARHGGELVCSELRRLAQHDPDWFVRARTFTLLAETNAPGATEFLLDALAALEPDIVGSGDEENAVEVISDGTRRMRAAIIVGLRVLGLTDEEIASAQRPEELEDLEMALFPEGEESMAGWSETLGALSDQDAARRAEAARQLAEAGLPAVDGLRRALRDPDPLVRAEAARSLGRIGARDGLHALAGCLLDPDPGVRLASAAAMRAIVTRDAARELRD